MLIKDFPIRRKMMTVILLTSGAVLLLTCSAYFAYEFFTFRQTTVGQLSTLGEIVATNSTAALAFDSKGDADEILNALKADSHIVGAALYDKNGNLFSYYPTDCQPDIFPKTTHQDGYYFDNSFLIGIQPVVQEGKRIGTLYLKSDMNRMYERLKLYGTIALLVISLSSLLAYFLSSQLQRNISDPILALAEAARSVSKEGDYSVRAAKISKDELGDLTDAFNQMLTHIEEQTLEITSFNQRLEQKVVERTLEMELANKELEAFSYSVSHDLRAPLRSIHGYMNIFAEEYAAQLDEEGKRLIDIILQNGQRMGHLIDDLLEFSKLGRREIIKSTVSITDIVTGILDEQKKAEPQRNIRMTLFDLPNVKADIATIRQVWTNLISNAFKYTRHREEAIIEIGSIAKDGETVFYVKDNGAGFDMKYYNKLFGVFQRLHSVRDFDGTGVGLAIVQRIIAKHGGKIWADARPNEGATFYFSLPNELPS